HRHEEGADTARTPFQHGEALVFKSFYAADAGTDDHTDAVPVNGIKIQTRVLDGHSRRSDGELGKAVHTLCIPTIHVVVRIKVFYLGRYLRSQVRSVKPSDTPHSGSAAHQTFPKSRQTVADGSKRTHPGDDDTSFLSVH